MLNIKSKETFMLCVQIKNSQGLIKQAILFKSIKKSLGIYLFQKINLISQISSDVILLTFVILLFIIFYVKFQAVDLAKINNQNDNFNYLTDVNKLYQFFKLVIVVIFDFVHLCVYIYLMFLLIFFFFLLSKKLLMLFFLI
ncbi:transmembrane protein, putative (macronuclear) [Tetrahymena thermophila SB210]|uniref:Transmembrane protein, putative n=1 Tax=Tetrahymena thermophila (strain SB210) TaxID=312017 RepID=W7XJB4_TETTS|nr:transmembrane protein, putative [Tetrahymena thermophila SB210]EWS74014.1 transmembrane protein, putative [Tetrahymena thermophila SB210]|eukprot:XP_012653476.1 transmembrane protein, putative [Tetrahymena thermophila SB210]